MLPKILLAMLFASSMSYGEPRWLAFCKNLLSPSSSSSSEVQGDSISISIPHGRQQTLVLRLAGTYHNEFGEPLWDPQLVDEAAVAISEWSKSPISAEWISSQTAKEFDHSQTFYLLIHTEETADPVGVLMLHHPENQTYEAFVQGDLEIAIYLGESARRRGIASTLFKSIPQILKVSGLSDSTRIAFTRVDTSNEASIGLHEHLKAEGILFEIAPPSGETNRFFVFREPFDWATGRDFALFLNPKFSPQ